MTDILHSPPPQMPSPSSSVDDGLHSLINTHSVDFYRRDNSTQIQQDVEEQEEEGDQLSVLAALVTAFRKSLVGCRSAAENCRVEELMEIGWPTNVRHVAHVTFDRFNGFLGLPVEFEPEVPRRPPSASTRVFGVSTESMQLSFDSRGNCVPTILLMMQRRLYSQGGLQAEGIFRINAENGQEEYVREQLNNGEVPDNIEVHCLAGLIKVPLHDLIVLNPFIRALVITRCVHVSNPNKYAPTILGKFQPFSLYIASISSNGALQAWFRELPRGVLDSLPSDEVMQAQSEEECTRLVQLLPPTDAALLDWAINLMADVAQLENMNKMNARNIAMVFAPNMTQMADPLTALMYAVQSLLIEMTVMTLSEPIINEANGATAENKLNVAEVSPSRYNPNSSTAELKTGNGTHGFLSSIKNILPGGKWHTVDTEMNRLEGGNTSTGSEGIPYSKSKTMKTGQSSNSNVKKVAERIIQQPVVHVSKDAEKSKELRVTSRINSPTERVEAWR
ncbi:Rho GTPase-activating protein 1 [Abeliophyllum distichum]|uniref:Rho GTPase-activating protein 1 n=1 Tax=Abeliophyllum distichum TaxID=126358 RepID=A0ABD1QZQ6_9LAMI